MKFQVISPAEAKRLNAVESAYSEPESIAKAIGSATKVVVTIGPAEKGATAEVTTDEALQVVRAAELAAATHVVVVYDASSSVTNGSTYNVIDGITSFFNNISSMLSQSQPLTIEEFLEKLVESDIRYTVIKTALTEDYSPQSEHGLVISGERNGSAAGSNEPKVSFLSDAKNGINKILNIAGSYWGKKEPHMDFLIAKFLCNCTAGYKVTDCFCCG
jgi:NAD(P)H-binding